MTIHKPKKNNKGRKPTQPCIVPQKPIMAESIAFLEQTFKNRSELRSCVGTGLGFSGILVSTAENWLLGQTVILRIRLLKENLEEIVRGKLDFWGQPTLNKCQLRQAWIVFYSMDAKKLAHLLDERRQAPRYQRTVQVSYLAKSARAVGYTSNISTGGMFVRTNDTPALGNQIDFSLVLIKNHNSSANLNVLIRGQVVWTVPSRGFGVRFLECQIDQQSKILQLASPVRATETTAVVDMAEWVYITYDCHRNRSSKPQPQSEDLSQTKFDDTEPTDLHIEANPKPITLKKISSSKRHNAPSRLGSQPDPKLQYQIKPNPVSQAPASTKRLLPDEGNIETPWGIYHEDPIQAPSQESISWNDDFIPLAKKSRGIKKVLVVLGLITLGFGYFTQTHSANNPKLSALLDLGSMIHSTDEMRPEETNGSVRTKSVMETASPPQTLTTPSPAALVPQQEVESISENSPDVVKKSAAIEPPLFSKTRLGWQITLHTNPNTNVKKFHLQHPPRLVFDITDDSNSLKPRHWTRPTPFLSEVRLGKKKTGTRLVFEFVGRKVPNYHLRMESDGLKVAFW